MKASLLTLKACRYPHKAVQRTLVWNLVVQACAWIHHTCAADPKETLVPATCLRDEIIFFCCAASPRPRQALANPSPHGTPQDGVQAYSGQTPCPGSTALPEREFQGQVLRLLNVIRLSLQQVASTLDALTASSEPTAAPNPVVPQPFDTADGLSNFKADLSASDEALLIKELIQLGERNPNSATKRMLAYLLTDKLAAEYSWEGKKGKKFCKLRICQLMCAVNKRFTQSTKDDDEVATKSWLRHAPEREYGKASQR